MNRALLNKWLWRFGVEREASWRCVVATKYGEEQTGWVSGRLCGLIGCGVWNNIHKGSDLFRSFLSFRINNRERVRFW